MSKARKTRTKRLDLGEAVEGIERREGEAGMTEQELDAIEKRAANATNEPWRQGNSSHRTTTENGHEIATWKHSRDQEFGANARTDVPRLVAEVRRLQSAIRWALGEGDEFPPRREGQGAYWWRTELGRRAGLRSKG